MPTAAQVREERERRRAEIAARNAALIEEARNQTTSRPASRPTRTPDIDPNEGVIPSARQRGQMAYQNTRTRDLMGGAQRWTEQAGRNNARVQLDRTEAGRREAQEKLKGNPDLGPMPFGSTPYKPPANTVRDWAREIEMAKDDNTKIEIHKYALATDPEYKRAIDLSAQQELYNQNLDDSTVGRIGKGIAGFGAGLVGGFTSGADFAVNRNMGGVQRYQNQSIVAQEEAPIAAGLGQFAGQLAQMIYLSNVVGGGAGAAAKAAGFGAKGVARTASAATGFMSNTIPSLVAGDDLETVLRKGGTGALSWAAAKAFQGNVADRLAKGLSPKGKLFRTMMANALQLSRKIPVAKRAKVFNFFNQIASDSAFDLMQTLTDPEQAKLYLANPEMMVRDFAMNLLFQGVDMWKERHPDGANKEFASEVKKLDAARKAIETAKTAAQLEKAKAEAIKALDAFEKKIESSYENLGDVKNVDDVKVLLTMQKGADTLRAMVDYAAPKVDPVETTPVETTKVAESTFDTTPVDTSPVEVKAEEAATDLKTRPLKNRDRLQLLPPEVDGPSPFNMPLKDTRSKNEKDLEFFTEITRNNAEIRSLPIPNETYSFPNKYVVEARKLLGDNYDPNGMMKDILVGIDEYTKTITDIPTIDAREVTYIRKLQDKLRDDLYKAWGSQLRDAVDVGRGNMREYAMEDRIEIVKSWNDVARKAMDDYSAEVQRVRVAAKTRANDPSVPVVNASKSKMDALSVGISGGKKETLVSDTTATKRGKKVDALKYGDHYIIPVTNKYGKTHYRYFPESELAVAKASNFDHGERVSTQTEAKKRIVESKKPVSPVSAEKVQEVEGIKENGEVQAKEETVDLQRFASSLKPEEMDTTVLKGEEDVKQAEEYISTYEKYRPDELDKEIANLEARVKGADGKMYQRVNLQLFAAKVAKERYLKGTNIVAETEAGPTRMHPATVARDMDIPEAVRKNMEERAEKGEYAYQKVILSDLGKRAKARVDANLDSEFSTFIEKVNAGKRLNAEDAAVGEVLEYALAKSGDPRYYDVLSAMMEYGTTYGQFIAALDISRTMDGLGFVRHEERLIERINRDGEKTHGDKWKKIELTPEERQKILDTKPDDFEGRDAIGKEIKKRLETEIPPTLLDKLDSWRMISMLFNPTTHIRNIAGNLATLGLRKVSDVLDTGLERIFMRGELADSRTKAIRISKEASAIADNVWKTEEDNIFKGTDRFDTSDRKVFGRNGKEGPVAKALNTLNHLTGWSLTAEDAVFLGPAFKDQLAQILTARKTSEVTPEMIEIAADYAARATFRQFSATARAISRLKAVQGPFIVRRNGVIDTHQSVENSLKNVLALVARAQMPFVKTPINIFKTGLDYSILGAGRGVLTAATSGASSKAIKAQAEAQGKPMTDAEVQAELAIRSRNLSRGLEQISKGLTGTGLAAIGMMLANIGIITGPPEEDADKAAYKKAVGEAPFAVKVDLPNGKSAYIGIEWAQPAVIPLIMGVVMAQKIREKGLSADGFMEAIAAGEDTLFAMPMLQSIARTMSAFNPTTGGSTSKGVSTAVEEFTMNYFKQLVPSLMGKLARITDRTERSMYEPNDGVLPKALRKYGRFVASRIPGASTLLEPQVDIWGNDKQQLGGDGLGGVLARTGLNLFSPGQVSVSKDTTRVEEEIARVYEAVKDEMPTANSVFPRVLQTWEGTIDGVDMTPEEFTKYQKDRGTKTYDLMEAGIVSGAYTKLSDSDKASYLTWCNTQANAYAKAKLQGEEYKPPKYELSNGMTGSNKKTFTLTKPEYMLYERKRDEYKAQGYTNASELARYDILKSKGLSVAPVKKEK